MPHRKGARGSAKEIRVSQSPRHRLEVRQNTDGSRSLEGYFCTYATVSHDLGGFKERLQPGCFDKSLRQQAMTALVNHDDNKLLGKTGQNMIVTSDGTGLRFRVSPLPDTSYSQDLVALANQSLVDSCSFGFYCVSDEWSSLPDGTPLRTVTEAIIFEGSVLAGPEAAYPSTSVSLRAQRRAKAKRDDLDDDCDEGELNEDGTCPDDEEDSRADQCKVDDPELDTLRLRLRIAQQRAKRPLSH
jgi:uncharacterized protein